MKCDENGCFHINACPFDGYCNPNICHLTPADFPIINAMIAGEFNCEYCANEDCVIYGANCPCAKWQPEEAT